jgi:polyhydroxybutyrate depolymerase
VPVVVDMHGYSEGAQVHQLHTLLHELGEEEGFVTIYPNGQGPVPRWDAQPGSSDSVWFGELLDELEASLCVDTNRVYATGLSNGAFMTSTVVCDHADRIAAAAPVAGIQAPEDCDPSRPVPFVAFHGTEDTFVPFEGGLGSAVADLPSPDGEGTLGDAIDEAADGDEAVADRTGVPEASAAWAERNGCEAEPTEESIADDVTLVTFDCPVGAASALYRVEGGGHTWPGAEFLATATDLVGTTTFSIDANELIWAFFEAHPLGLAG